MDVKTDKKDNKKLKNFLIGITSIIVIGFSVFLVANWWSNLVDESNRVAAIQIEQSKENVKLAEEMVEKELNTSSKYFQMLNRSGDFFSYGAHLDSNTGSYWIDKNLEAEVQLDGDSYMVSFETKRVDSKSEEVEMYEPVKINKIIKNGSE